MHQSRVFCSKTSQLGRVSKYFQMRSGERRCNELRFCNPGRAPNMGRLLHQPSTFAAGRLSPPSQQMHCAAAAAHCSAARVHSGEDSDVVLQPVFTSVCSQQRLLPLLCTTTLHQVALSNPVQITLNSVHSSTVHRVFPDVLLENKLGQFRISVWDDLNNFFFSSLLAPLYEQCSSCSSGL